MNSPSKARRDFPSSAKLLQLRDLWHSDRGQSLIELALLTPVLLILVVGIVEMGRYTSMSIEVGNAARAGAQYGAQNLAKAADQNGITCAAENESLSAGTAPACPSSNPLGLAITFPAGTTTVCGCDDGGTITPMASCTSACGQHFVVSVQVTAKATFNPLFSYAKPLFGYVTIPAITVTDTATERVAQ